MRFSLRNGGYYDWIMQRKQIKYLNAGIFVVKSINTLLIFLGLPRENSLIIRWYTEYSKSYQIFCWEYIYLVQNRYPDQFKKASKFWPKLGALNIWARSYFSCFWFWASTYSILFIRLCMMKIWKGLRAVKVLINHRPEPFDVSWSYLTSISPGASMCLGNLY